MRAVLIAFSHSAEHIPINRRTIIYAFHYIQIYFRRLVEAPLTMMRMTEVCLLRVTTAVTRSPRTVP